MDRLLNDGVSRSGAEVGASTKEERAMAAVSKIEKGRHDLIPEVEIRAVCLELHIEELRSGESNGSGGAMTSKQRREKQIARHNKLRSGERNGNAGAISKNSGGWLNRRRHVLPIVARPPVLLAVAFPWNRDCETHEESIAVEAKVSRSSGGDDVGSMEPERAAGMNEIRELGVAAGTNRARKKQGEVGAAAALGKESSTPSRLDDYGDGDDTFVARRPWRER